ncbi:MAG: hypothetical protein E7J86_00005, partial [Aeromonas caviae]|nr:hypothetical protein [Aeromonas caviae]
RQQGDGGGVFGDSQFTSTLSVNFHFPKIPRRTNKRGALLGSSPFKRRHQAPLFLSMAPPDSHF